MPRAAQGGWLSGPQVCYGLNLCRGTCRGIYTVLGGDLLRDMLQIKSRAQVHCAL